MVEAFVEAQIRVGICPAASTLVNDVLRSLSEDGRRFPAWAYPKHSLVLRSLSEDGRRFLAVTPEWEAWLLQAADSPTSRLTFADFDGIRERARTRQGRPAMCIGSPFS